MRSLVVIAALTTTAAAAPGYPLHIAKLSQAERAQRKEAFAQRQTATWTDVIVDSRGFVVHLATEDPAIPATLNGVDLGPVRELLRREATSFGIDPADLDGEWRSLGSCGNQLVHERNGAMLGRIDVTCTVVGAHVKVIIDVMPWLDVNPKLGPDDASKRVLGGRYAITTRQRMVPARDCNMGGTCVKPHWETHRSVVTFAVEDLVGVEAAVYRQGDALRLVYCVDAAWNAPEPNTVVEALGAARPLPYVVDAVTGAELALRPRTCAAIPSL